MKLSVLVTHTSIYLAMDRANVESHSRYLREAGLLTTGARGLAAPEMTRRDAALLFVSTCGVSVARQNPVEIPAWVERAPGLIEHIESCIKNRSVETAVEFDVDGYCARFIKDNRTRTFGERLKDPRYRSQTFLVRQIPATAFTSWLDGVRYVAPTEVD